jgi:tRNA pseudouridine55 synthase
VTADGSGVVVIDKPPGWTSHQVVGRVRRLAGTRKVGHAGTLDPMATGVLVVGINRATRLLGHLTLTDKGYSAIIRLGVSTLTDDAEGEVTATRGAVAADLGPDLLERHLAALRGAIWQAPAAVSAIKVGGVRSYARVRAGEKVQLVPRQVTVSRLELRRRTERMIGAVPVVDLTVAVECSSGTYVRALARDLGASLGTGGHLTELRRTRVGPFTVDQAVTLEAATGSLPVIGLEEVARTCFVGLTLTEEQAAAVRYGRRLEGLALSATPTAVFAPAGDFLALYRPAGGGAVPEAVFVG